MLGGEWFDPRDAELTAIRDNATRLMHRLNVELCGHGDAYRAALHELCPGCEGFIREPFRCDYGLNISVGEGSFVNFDCVFLDLAPIRIGRHTLIGPKVQLLTRPAPVRRGTAPRRARGGPPDHRRRRLLAGRRGDRLPGGRDRRPLGHRRRSRRDARHPGRFGSCRKPGARDPHAAAARRNRIVRRYAKNHPDNSSFSSEIFYFCRIIE